MLFSIIQIIIAIVLIYFVFSVIVYVISEWIAGFLELRGLNLRHAIHEVFNDNLNKDFGSLLYSHPQVENLKRNSDKLPSYIPSRNIAIGLIHIVSKEANPYLYKVNESDGTLERLQQEQNSQFPDAFEQFKNGLSTLNESHFKTLLINLVQHTTDLPTLTKILENWYDNYMERVTGWYKNRIRKIILIIAVFVTIAFNVDSIYIINQLAVDPNLQARMNDNAVQIVSDSVYQKTIEQNLATDLKAVEDLYQGSEYIRIARDSVIQAHLKARQAQLSIIKQDLASWDLPIGWHIQRNNNPLLMLLGWFISALALTAGAPFWFDLLKKLVNVRYNGIKPLSTTN